MRHICYIVLSHSPLPLKRNLPLLTGDINLQSSHLNNGKIKIVYNSAYVHIETKFYLRLASRFVYFYLCQAYYRSKLPDAMRRHDVILHVFCPYALRAELNVIRLTHLHRRLNRLW